MNILIIDDERLFVKGLKTSLEREGYRIFTAYDGEDGLNLVRKEKIDLVILDLMLPSIDGITVCKKIRENMDVPIIMLTAKDDYADMVLGLELGADDYITKPFNTRVLIARIKAISRRAIYQVKNSDNIFNIDELEVDFLARTVKYKDEEIELTAKEFEILSVLIKNRGIVLSREKIFSYAWNELDMDTRTVDVHISKIREKIEENPSKPIFIKTKWGVGYFFRKEKNNA